jgi:hypothetical protein
VIRKTRIILVIVIRSSFISECGWLHSQSCHRELGAAIGGQRLYHGEFAAIGVERAKEVALDLEHVADLVVAGRAQSAVLCRPDAARHPSYHAPKVAENGRSPIRPVSNFGRCGGAECVTDFGPLRACRWRE